MNIEHVAMYVNDPDAARDFFIKYLGSRSNGGYRNPNTGFRSNFLSFDGGARLEIMSRPGMAELPKDPARTGYAHIAFSMGSRENVDELTARLRADGFDVISGPRTTGDGYYESCIVAIEQNMIELTVRTGGESGTGRECYDLIFFRHRQQPVHCKENFGGAAGRYHRP